MRFFRYTIALLLNIILVLTVSSCGKDVQQIENSVVSVFAADREKSATGIALGEPGKPAKYILTICSNIINRDGSIPKSVEIKDNAGNAMTAGVYDYNTEKNLAVLELPQKSERICGVIFEEAELFKSDGQYNIYGYPSVDATSTKSVNTVQATGANVRKTSRYKSMDVYEVDFSYEDGFIGGVLVSSDMNAIGIVAHSKADDYTYAIATEAIMSFIGNMDIDMVLKHAYDIKLYIVIVLIISILIVLSAVICIIYIFKSKKSSFYATDMTQEVTSSVGQTVVNTTANVKAADDNVCLRLRINGGALKGIVFDVGADEILIGRDYKRCAVVYPINEPGISGVHCSVRCENGILVLRDMRSTFGTFTKAGMKLQAGMNVYLRRGDGFYPADEKNMFEVM